MYENVSNTLTSISDIHSITSSVYFRLSFLFWPFLPTHCECRALLQHLTITHTHPHTFGLAPLDDRSAHRRDLYLTTHNTHMRQASITTAQFKSAIPASERPQTYAWVRAADGIGLSVLYEVKIRTNALCGHHMRPLSSTNNQTFRRIFMKLGIGNLHKQFYSVYELRENWLNTLHMGVN